MPRLLDLDDLGALLAEQPGAERRRDAGAEIEHPQARRAGPRHVGRAVDGVGRGQAEHPLADDVALDLVGAGEDRRRLVVEPRPLPLAVARVAVGAAPQRRGRAEHGIADVVQPLAHLAPVELERAALGPELERPCSSRESERQLCSWNSRTSTYASASRCAMRWSSKRRRLERQAQQLLEELARG